MPQEKAALSIDEEEGPCRYRSHHQTGHIDDKDIKQERGIEEY